MHSVLPVRCAEQWAVYFHQCNRFHFAQTGWHQNAQITTQWTGYQLIERESITRSASTRRITVYVSYRNVDRNDRHVFLCRRPRFLFPSAGIQSIVWLSERSGAIRIACPCHLPETRNWSSRYRRHIWTAISDSLDKRQGGNLYLSVKRHLIVHSVVRGLSVWLCIISFCKQDISKPNLRMFAKFIADNAYVYDPDSD